MVNFLELINQIYPSITPELIVTAFIYLDRVLSANSSHILTETNAKCLLHVAIVMAAKYGLD